MSQNHQEIAELNSIQGSRAYQNLLAKRKAHIQGEVNKAVRDQNLIKAYGELCKLDDINKTFKVIASRVKELEEDNG